MSLSMTVNESTTPSSETYKNTLSFLVHRTQLLTYILIVMLLQVLTAWLWLMNHLIQPHHSLCS